MRTLLLQLLVCATALFPLAQTQAASFASKSFGGFAPGATFKLTMTDNPVGTTAGVGGGGVLTSIPAGYPKYKKGTVVTFKIGKRGELIVANFSIPLHTVTATNNVYSPKTAKPGTSFSQAALTKSAGKVTFMNLVLRKTSGSGMSTKITQIVYLLQ